MSVKQSQKRFIPVKPPKYAGLFQKTLDRLNGIGFNRPVDFLENKDIFRVSRAVDYALSKPPGVLRNVTGFIRDLVDKGEPIPTVKDKFGNQIHGRQIHKQQFGSIFHT